MKLESTADTDTEIPWWNENRKKFNVVVEAYNDWLMYGWHKEGADIERKALLMRLDLLEEEIASKSPFAEEPIARMRETLTEMEQIDALE